MFLIVTRNIDHMVYYTEYSIKFRIQTQCFTVYNFSLSSSVKKLLSDLCKGIFFPNFNSNKVKKNSVSSSEILLCANVHQRFLKKNKSFH